MSGLRFRIDFFVPLDPKTGKVSVELQNKVNAIKTSILDFKNYSTKINDGKIDQEDTTKAIFHKCYHDEDPSKPCDQIKDISEWTKDSGPAIIKKQELGIWGKIKNIFGRILGRKR